MLHQSMTESSLPMYTRCTDWAETGKDLVHLDI
jgi:hypothetical protein